jgi:hypothetical protein
VEVVIFLIHSSFQSFLFCENVFQSLQTYEQTPTISSERGVQNSSVRVNVGVSSPSPAQAPALPSPTQLSVLSDAVSGERSVQNSTVTVNAGFSLPSPIQPPAFLDVSFFYCAYLILCF